MNVFMDKLAEKMLPIAQKLGANRYLAAIRDSFITVMPIIIGCSLFTLLNCVFLGEGNYFDQWFGFQGTAIVNMGNAICSAGINIMTLLLVYLIAKNLSDYYHENSATMAVTALVCFLIITSFGTNDEAGEYIRTYYLGSAGMFTGFIAAIGTVEIMRHLMKIKALIIKMPESVPTGIARSFNSMIPVILTMIIFGIIRLITDTLGMPLNDLIFNGLQQPLTAIITSPIGLIIVYVLYMLLWGFGIHSAYIIGTIIEPIYLANITANIELINSGQEAVNILTKPFADSLMFMGGAGNMLALIIAIFIIAKREDYRDVAKLGLVPAIFNISEPIMFGLPVVMNPILIIPMILVTLVSLFIGYIATFIGFMAVTYVQIPWTTPPIIGAFLSTGGDIKAAIIAIICLIVSVLIYMPFVKVMDKAIENQADIQ